jgi:hypothetical protein
VLWSLAPGIGLIALAGLLVVFGGATLAVPSAVGIAVDGGSVLMGLGRGFGSMPDFDLDSRPAPRSSASSSFSSAPSSAPTIASAPASDIDLDDAEEISIEDFVSDPDSYKGKLVRFEAWWKDYNQGWPVVSPPNSLTDVTLRVHDLAKRPHGDFLAGLQITDCELTVRGLGRLADYSYIGDLIAVKLKTAKKPRVVYPSKDEITAAETKKAAEKEAAAQKEKERKEKKAALEAKLAAAAEAKDFHSIETMLAAPDAQLLEGQLKSKLTKDAKAFKEAAAAERAGKAVDEKIAAQDFRAAYKLLDEAQKDIGSHWSPLRDRIRDAVAPLQKKATEAAPFEVKLDDGSTVLVDCRKLADRLAATSVSFVGRETENPELKPIRLKVEYVWLDWEKDATAIQATSKPGGKVSATADARSFEVVVWHARAGKKVEIWD